MIHCPILIVLGPNNFQALVPMHCNVVVSKASKLITMFSIFRSVSYPTPTYYAHLVADRARKHHNELAGYECGGSTSGNSAGSVRLTEAEKRKIQEVLERGVAKPMYFV